MFANWSASQRSKDQEEKMTSQAFGSALAKLRLLASGDDCSNAALSALFSAPTQDSSRREADAAGESKADAVAAHAAAAVHGAPAEKILEGLSRLGAGLDSREVMGKWLLGPEETMEEGGDELSLSADEHATRCL
jgi:hypothetical protein